MRESPRLVGRSRVHREGPPLEQLEPALDAGAAVEEVAGRGRDDPGDASQATTRADDTASVSGHSNLIARPELQIK